MVDAAVVGLTNCNRYMLEEVEAVHKGHVAETRAILLLASDDSHCGDHCTSMMKSKSLSPKIKSELPYRKAMCDDYNVCERFQQINIVDGV